MIELLLQAWQQTSWLEVVSVAFGLAYVILAAKESVWCWPAALVGTGTGILVFWDASLKMESALNVFYLVMAVYGWWAWLYGGASAGRAQQTLSISSWRALNHLYAIALIAVLTAISGGLLKGNTNAALPYVDSFTTWAAVISTWMVTRKVLQNWLYWIVIDAVSVWLFIQRELYLYALLFVLYTVIAAFGYLNWRRRYVNQT